MCFPLGVPYFIEHETISVEHESLSGITIGHFSSEKKMRSNEKITEIEILCWAIVRMRANNVVCAKFIALFVIIETTQVAY